MTRHAQAHSKAAIKTIPKNANCSESQLYCFTQHPQLLIMIQLSVNGGAAGQPDLRKIDVRNLHACSLISKETDQCFFFVGIEAEGNIIIRFETHSTSAIDDFRKSKVVFFSGKFHWSHLWPQHTTDHMLTVSFDPETGWSAPEIKPYGPLSLDPASSCFQYCPNLFEGTKVGTWILEFTGPIVFEWNVNVSEYKYNLCILYRLTLVRMVNPACSVQA